MPPLVTYCKNRLSMRIFQSQPHSTVSQPARSRSILTNCLHNFKHGSKWICLAINCLPSTPGPKLRTSSLLEVSFKDPRAKRDFVVPRNLGPKLENFLYNWPAEVPFGKRRKNYPRLYTAETAAQFWGNPWHSWPLLTSSVPMQRSFSGFWHMDLWHQSQNIAVREIRPIGLNMEVVPTAGLPSLLLDSLRALGAAGHRCPF